MAYANFEETHGLYHVIMYVDGMEDRVSENSRLSVLRWKTEKETGKKLPTLAVIVPEIKLMVAPSCLQEAMQDAFEDMQDVAIRKSILQSIEENPGINVASLTVPESIGTPEGVANFNLEGKESKRLSKVKLENWFASEIKEPLELALAGIEGITEEKHSVAMKQHKELIIALASPKAVMKPSLARQLQKAINLASEGDRIKKQLNDKLEGFINPKMKEEEMLLSL